MSDGTFLLVWCIVAGCIIAMCTLASRRYWWSRTLRRARVGLGAYRQCSTRACAYRTPGTRTGLRWAVWHPVVHHVRIRRHRRNLR
jgi:hypothetical protein